MLIWFGSSLRPVATTAAVRRACAGSTSGSGLASANTTARSAIVAMSSPVRMPGALTPTKTSAPARASRSVPVSPAGLVLAASQARLGSSCVRRACTTPPMSHTTRCRAPAASSSRAIADPAAPAPDSTTRTCASDLPTTRSALVSAASTTIAVPCWSSWNTGMSSRSRSRRSTSKQRGAAMSSRLTPPKTGAISCTVRTISSTSWVSRQIGQASIPANRLNSAALPSITGSAAAGPRLPSPSTAEPSVTTATALRLIVSRRASSGCAAIARQTRATPGVYAMDRSSRLRSGTLERTSILPPRCSRNVRSLTLPIRTPSTARSASTSRSACGWSLAAQVTSTTIRSG